MENSTAQSKRSREVFETIAGLLGLSVKVADSANERNITLAVETDEPGRLIGRNGSSLDNVGLIMNRILKKTENDFPKVVINVDGYDKSNPKEKRKPTPGPNQNQRKERRPKQGGRPEKTIYMNETAPVSTEESINVYTDHETDKLDPVTTVALDNGSNSGDDRRPNGNRDRDNRRDNRRDDRRDNRRDDRRDNRRDDRRDNFRGNNNDRPRHERSQSSESGEAAPVAAQATEESADNSNQNRPNKLQMQCKNAAKEVKRWGEPILLPPLNDSECQTALEYLREEHDITAAIDSASSSGDRKRVRITLKG